MNRKIILMSLPIAMCLFLIGSSNAYGQEKGKSPPSKDSASRAELVKALKEFGKEHPEAARLLKQRFQEQGKERAAVSRGSSARVQALAKRNPQLARMLKQRAGQQQGLRGRFGQGAGAGPGIRGRAEGARMRLQELAKKHPEAAKMLRQRAQERAGQGPAGRARIGRSLERPGRAPAGLKPGQVTPPVKRQGRAATPPQGVGPNDKTQNEQIDRMKILEKRLKELEQKLDKSTKG